MEKVYSFRALERNRAFKHGWKQDDEAWDKYINGKKSEDQKSTGTKEVCKERED